MASTQAGVDRDLRIIGAAICLSALGDGVALVALALRAKELSGGGMGGGVSIAALFICLWAPLVVLAGHVGLLVKRGKVVGARSVSDGWDTHGPVAHAPGSE